MISIEDLNLISTFEYSMQQKGHYEKKKKVI